MYFGIFNEYALYGFFFLFHFPLSLSLSGSLQLHECVLWNLQKYRHARRQKQVSERVVCNCVLVHLVIWKNVCVSVSVCANLCEKSLLNHLPFLRLFVKKSVRYNSNTIIQAPHGTSIIFSCIRENYADDGWLKTSGAYQEIFFIHVLDEEMFAVALAAAATGCNCFYTASNNGKSTNKNTGHTKQKKSNLQRQTLVHTRSRANKPTL